MARKGTCAGLTIDSMWRMFQSSHLNPVKTLLPAAVPVSAAITSHGITTVRHGSRATTGRMGRLLRKRLTSYTADNVGGLLRLAQAAGVSSTTRLIGKSPNP